MKRIQPALPKSLQFNTTGAENERMVDIAPSIKQNALATRRNHSSRNTTVPAKPYELVYYPADQKVHSLAADGGHYADATLIDSGYNTLRGSFLVITPASNLSDQYIFVAAGKMSKYRSGVGTQKWGIEPPPAAAVTVVLSNIDIVINLCNAATNWTVTGTGATVATNDNRIEGSASLIVHMNASVESTLTFTPAAPINLSTAAWIRFWAMFPSPETITHFTMQISFGDTAFSSNFATYQVAGTNLADISPPFTWKEQVIARSIFVVSGTANWADVRAVRFTFASTVGQDFNLDAVIGRPIGVDDIVGPRYKYRYKNTTTSHTSNLNSLPSAQIPTDGIGVTVSGLVPSTDPQVDQIEIFRDVGGDGNFKKAGDKANAAGNYTDITPTTDLRDVDSNDNAQPVAATLATFFAGSVWINDINYPYRIWRSVAGRYESFSEFFDLPITDIVQAIPIVGGQLCIVTTNNIYRVVGADTTRPRFVPFLDIGITSQTAITITNDVAYLAHFTGGYIFNGSTIQIDPIISRLFMPSASDTRRINETNIFSVILGSDDKHVWLTYTALDGFQRTLVRDNNEGAWSEESEVITAHDRAHLTYPHIVANLTNALMNCYSGSFARFDYASPELSLPTIASQEISLEQKKQTSRSMGISRVTNLGIELSNTVSVTVTAYVDSIGRAALVVSPASRRWVFLKFEELENVIGERLSFTIFASSEGLVELYASEWWLAEMQEDVVTLDSGEVFLSSELVASLELNVHLFAHEQLTYSVHWYIDSMVQLVAQGVVAYGPSNNRWFLRPDVGRTGRLVIYASGRFSPIANVASVITLGTGEVKPVEIRTAST